MYPPIQFTKGGLRLVLERGSGKIGSQYVEIHVWLWFPDTGWGWINAQITDSKPPMLANHRDTLLKLLRHAHTPLRKLKTREALESSLESLSHTFPSKLPDLSFRAKEVTDALPNRGPSADRSTKPRRSRGTTRRRPRTL